MSFADYAEKYKGQRPIVLFKYSLDSGDVRMAKVNVVSTNFWEALVRSFGSLTRSIADADGAFEVSDIDIVIENANQEISGSWDVDKIKNRTGELIVGFEGMAIGDFKTIFTGIGEAYSFPPNEFRLKLKDPTEKYFDNKDWFKTISPDDWTDAHSKALNKMMPLIYGDKTGCITYCVDTVNYKYLAAGHAGKDVVTVYKEDSAGVRTELTEGLHWSWTNQSFDGDYVTMITMVGDHSDYKIIADIQGIEDTGDGTGDLITNPVLQLEHFITTWLALPSALYSSSDFSDAETIVSDRGYVGACCLTKQQNAKDVITNMCLGMYANAYRNTSGQFSIFIFESAVQAGYSGAREYNERWDMLRDSCTFEPDLNIQANHVIIKYDYDPSLDTWKGLWEDEDSTSISDTLETLTTTLYLDFVADASTASDIGQRYLLHNKNASMKAYFYAPLVALDDDLAQPIRVTHRSGPDGGYSRQLFQITRISPDLDGLSCAVEARDINQWLTTGFVLGDETVLPADWDNADEDERYYAYLCDETTEQFDDGTAGKRL